MNPPEGYSPVFIPELNTVGYQRDVKLLGSEEAIRQFLSWLPGDSLGMILQKQIDAENYEAVEMVKEIIDLKKKD